MRYIQDASVDLSNIDNEFHSVRYIDYFTGVCYTKFLCLVEKPRSGAQGQVDAFRSAISSLFFDQPEVKKENILELIKENHCNKIEEYTRELIGNSTEIQELNSDEVFCVADDWNDPF